MIEIGRVAHTRPHLLADTLEIAIAFGDYHTISMTDAVGIINGSPRVEAELLPLDVDDLDDNNYSDDLDGSEINAKEQARVEEAIRQIEYRIGVFGDAYPFALDAEVVSLKTDLTEKNKVYLLLLACSRSRSFKHRGAAQKLADCFEEVSAACLQRMISPYGRTFMFGPNSQDRKTTFAGGLSAALPTLTATMGMRLKKDWEKNFGNSGDAKIDLVGVYNFNDTAAGFKVSIAQCAAMEDENDWERKRQEAQLAHRSGSFDFLVEPDAVLFIPACYRQPDGSWINSDKVSNVITVDRVRIINILSHTEVTGLNVDHLYAQAGIQLAA
ncbi:hypothetical protein [Rhizobium leguminosarum]|uniref:hypothetical protein n=1 Tax=Rhizobium leguminosarum TaxID=384 RepID=UPI003F9A3C47